MSVIIHEIAAKTIPVTLTVYCMLQQMEPLIFAPFQPILNLEIEPDSLGAISAANSPIWTILVSMESSIYFLGLQPISSRKKSTASQHNLPEFLSVLTLTGSCM